MVKLLKSSFSAFGEETIIKQVLLGKKIYQKKGNKKSSPSIPNLFSHLTKIPNMKQSSQVQDWLVGNNLYPGIVSRVCYPLGV